MCLSLSLLNITICKSSPADMWLASLLPSLPLELLSTLSLLVFVSHNKIGSEKSENELNTFHYAGTTFARCSLAHNQTSCAALRNASSYTIVVHNPLGRSRSSLVRVRRFSPSLSLSLSLFLALSTDHPTIAPQVPHYAGSSRAVTVMRSAGVAVVAEVVAAASCVASPLP